MDIFELIKEMIKTNIQDAEVDVSDMRGTMGAKDHLNIVVTSSAFKGKSLLAQHQMVMQSLKEGLKEDIHAVQIKTIIK